MAKRKETTVEKRLKAGATILKTFTADAVSGAAWTFSDSGKSARASTCEKLLADGLLKPLDRSLFGDDAQTYGWAQVQ